MPPGTMRGFTVVCMQSSPYFAQGTYVQSIVCAEQSMDCLHPYFAHGTIHGLRAQSTDYCAICGSIDCAGQSMDCPNPYFAHNICIARTLHVHVFYDEEARAFQLIHLLYFDSDKWRKILVEKSKLDHFYCYMQVPLQSHMTLSLKPWLAYSSSRGTTRTRVGWRCNHRQAFPCHRVRRWLVGEKDVCKGSE